MATRYADQRAHDVTWMTAAEREDYGMALDAALIDALAGITSPPVSVRLAALRAELAAAGWTAESPAVLDAEGERLSREEKRS